MEQINYEIDKLLQMIENSHIVDEYLHAKENVINDKKLLSMIEKYHQGNSSFKETILKNQLYQQYHEKSMELSILIWAINLRFKKIKGGHSCELSKENIKDIQ